jgi:hypothetical protein
MKITATGATFWFERSSSNLLTDPKGLILNNCVNLKIEGLIIDFDPPVVIQGKITNLNTSNNTIDIKVDDGFPMPDNFTGQMILFKSNGVFMPQNALFHKGFETIGARSLRVTATDNKIFAGNTSQGLQKAFGSRANLQAGDYLALPIKRGNGAIYINNCETTTMKNIYIYASPGLGIHELSGNGNIYDGVKIKRRPGSNRLLACNSDTFHSSSDIKGPTIRNCEFSYNCDDFINIYGLFAVVGEKLAADKYIIGTMRGESPVIGEKLDFYNKDSIELLGSSTIKSVQRSSADDQKIIDTVKLMGTYVYPSIAAYIVTLNGAVNVSKSALVDTNSHNASSFIVENNYFHDSIGRALLASAAGGGLIQNNRWQRLEGGINIMMESWAYLSGTFANNIIIKSNRFEDIYGYSSTPTQDAPVQGYIYVGMAPSGNYLRNYIVNRKVEIIGNYIENPPSTPILVAYTDGVKITNNKVKNPYFLIGNLGRPGGANYYTENPESIVYVTTSKNITVSGNTADDPSGFLKSGEFTSKFCN